MKALVEEREAGNRVIGHWAIEELRHTEHADLIRCWNPNRRLMRSTFYYHLKNTQKKDKYREEKDMIYAIFHVKA